MPLIPAGLLVQQVLPNTDRIIILTEPKSPASCCPVCGHASGRVHSRYLRTLADLPWQGRVVALRVRARRFRCAMRACPRRVFTERLPEVAGPRARRTGRLADLQRHIGLALGGEAGSRLAVRLTVVVDVLADLFTARGTPAHVRSDKGGEFTAGAVRGWIAGVGARAAFIEKGSPWGNGYVESFNGKMRDELLGAEVFNTLAEAKVLIERWRAHCNTARPHSSLGCKPPAPEVVVPGAPTPPGRPGPAGPAQPLTAPPMICSGVNLDRFIVRPL